MKNLPGPKVLVVMTALLLWLTGLLWADNLYVIQGVVKYDDSGLPANGASVKINCCYQGQTLNTAVQCGTPYEGDGVYKIEGDAGCLNLCSSENTIRVEKYYNGHWYRGEVSKVWIWDGYCTPCGRCDITIYKDRMLSNCEQRPQKGP